MEKVTIGNAELYHGDCAVILPQLEPVDLILTDPPYGIGEAANNNKSRGKRASSRDYGKDDWDNAPPAAWLFGLMQEKSKHQIIFGGNYFALPPTRCVLVWDKDNGANDFADCELAWTNLNKAVRMKKWTWHGMRQENISRKEERVHPTQKPTGIMEWAIAQAPDDVMTICDPFMGSGTTGVAAMNLEKRFIGIEREKKYFDIARERIEMAQAQGRLAI
ncbi:MAG: DNA-methyltransferase [Cycloclasticus sp.]